MALITFVPLNKKNFFLFLFISIIVIASFIPKVFGLIMPFEIELIDYSSQLLIGSLFYYNIYAKKTSNIKYFLIFQN